MNTLFNTLYEFLQPIGIGGMGVASAAGDFAKVLSYAKKTTKGSPKPNSTTLLQSSNPEQ